MNVFQIMIAILPVGLTPGQSYDASQPKELRKEQDWQKARACGPNMLHLLLQANGKNEVKRSELFKHLNPPKDGSSLRELSEAANKFGLKVYIYKVGDINLDNLSVPFICHLSAPGSTGHYALVTGIEKTKVKMIDGNLTRVLSLDRDRFLKRWSGYILTSENVIANQYLKIIMTTEIISLILFSSIVLYYLIVYVRLTPDHRK